MSEFFWPRDRTHSGATTPGKSIPGSDGNEGILHIPQSSSTIRLFSVISRILTEVVSLLCRDVVDVFKSLHWLGQYICIWIIYMCIHIYIYLHTLDNIYISSFVSWVKCFPMTWETGFQSQVEPYQRHKEWYLMLPCLKLGIIRYGSKVKWSNPGKGEVPAPKTQSSSYWKESLQVTHNQGCQLYFLHRYIFLYKHTYV